MGCQQKLSGILTKYDDGAEIVCCKRYSKKEYKFTPGYYTSRGEREGIEATYYFLNKKKKTIAEKKEKLKDD
jgi:hypothetical protein